MSRLPSLQSLHPALGGIPRLSQASLESVLLACLRSFLGLPLSGTCPENLTREVSRRHPNQIIRHLICLLLMCASPVCGPDVHLHHCRTRVSSIVNTDYNPSKCDKHYAKLKLNTRYQTRLAKRLIKTHVMSFHVPRVQLAKVWIPWVGFKMQS